MNIFNALMIIALGIWVVRSLSQLKLMSKNIATDVAHIMEDMHKK